MQARKMTTILASSAKKAVRTGPMPGAEQLPRTVVETAVDRDKAAALAAFLGIDVTDVAPAALLRALCFEPTIDLLADRAVPVPVPGMVVTDQAWTLHRPVQLGTRVEVEACIATIRRSESGTEVLVRARVSVDGELAYDEETAYLAKRAGGAEAAIGQRWDARPIDHRQTYGVNEAGRLDLGQRAGLASRTFTVADTRAWASITGDSNPIHMSSVTAKLFGYRRAVLHGAAVDAWACARLGMDGGTPCSAVAHFRAPVLAGARVELVPMGAGDFAVVDAGSGRDLVHLRFTGTAGDVAAGGGLVLPRRSDGRSSSTVISRGMAAAATCHFPSARTLIEDVRPWRRRYRQAMTILSRYDAPQRGGGPAREGLAYLGENLRFSDGRTSSQAELVEVAGGDVVEGTGQSLRELRVPVGGRELAGDELLAVLRSWQDEGRIRAGAVDAIADVVADPDILNLDGWTFACLGPGAELSPAPHLLAWGGHVAAVARSELPELATSAAGSAGRLYLPPEPLDVVIGPGKAAGWVAGLPGRLAVVDTLYAPGSHFLLAAAGADVVERLVCQARQDTALAWYGSPSDAYLTDIPVRNSFGTGPAARVLRGYARLRNVAPSRSDGVYCGYIDVQGPNYAAAKRIGRWRATVEREAGRTVSYNVGPLSMTRSVLDARALRAAYGGMARLGMPPLEAETSAVLMAALLVWDLKHPEANAASATFMTDKAIDCGLFESPYAPGDLMGFAVGLGADRAVRG
ncbi:MAG: MaoC/PaaZ C-terminal domain-containing protein [Actinomycetaceae bacterium]|nr:MaoC/PaaZ C-terminal domain-containing protein [Actinomycetaceae bacterium]